MLITFELKPIKRITELEKTIGHYKFLDFEEHEPTLPEKIEALEQRTVLASVKTIEEKKEVNPIIKTILTMKAIELTEYLEKKN